MRTIHFNGAEKRSHNLVESNDIVVVRTKRNVDPLEIFAGIAGMSEYIPHLQDLDKFEASRVNMYRIINSQDTDALRTEIKELVRAAEHPDIDYIGSVLVYSDTGIYQLYTGNLFVKLQDSITRERSEALLKEYNLKLKLKLGFGNNAYFVEPIDVDSKYVFELAEKLLTFSEVQMCQPELIVKRKSIFKEVATDYTEIAKQHNWIYNKIKLFDSWKYSRGKGVKICVIDDGLDFEHPAFKDTEKIPLFKDMHDYTSDQPPAHRFNESHGTACAGIAVSSDPRAIGIAPDAQLIPIRSIGLGSVLESEAFYWAANNGADIISCSWGPPDGDFKDKSNNKAAVYPIPDHTDLAIKYAATKGRSGKGCLIFFAAGNGGEQVICDQYAAHENVMAIGSTNTFDDKASYSDYGYPLFCCFPSGDFKEVDGKWKQTSGVTVPDRVGGDGYAPGDIYDNFSGTSASCPGMAGITALALSLAPDASSEQIQHVLAQSCIPLGEESERKESGYHDDYGFGLIQADKVAENSSKLNQEMLDNPPANATPKGYSLHIGINAVSERFYKNLVPELTGCINDNNQMVDLAQRQGYEPKSLVNKEATRHNINKAIKKIARKATNGDVVLITYAGHGASVIDKNGEEADGFDEAWLAYDKFLLDDEFDSYLAHFRKGVRVFIIADTCYRSGISTTHLEAPPKGAVKRRVSPTVVRKLMDENAVSRQQLRGLFIADDQTQNTPQIKATIRYLNACQDDQYAYEVDGRGVFTRCLTECLVDKEKEDLDFEEILLRVNEDMPGWQTVELIP